MLQVDEVADEHEKLGSAIIHIAPTYRREGRWDDAKYLLEAGMRADVSPLHHAQMAVLLCRILIPHADYARAQTLLDKAIQLFTLTGQTSLLLAALCLRGDVQCYRYCACGDESPVQARRFYEDALQLGEDCDHSQGVVDASARIAYLYELEGETENARRWHNMALKQADSIQYTSGRVLPLNRLATACTHTGDTLKALAFHQDALDAATAAGDLEAISACLIYTGRAWYRVYHNKSRALAYLKQALSIAEKLNHRYLMVRASQALAVFHESCDERDQAESYRQQAEKIAVESGFSSGVAAVDYDSALL